MRKCLRFLLLLLIPAYLLFAAVLMAFAVLSLPELGALSKLLRLYASAMPTFVIMFLYILPFSLTTTQLSAALALGARRWDYFLALQPVFVLLPVLCWLPYLGADRILFRYLPESASLHWDCDPVGQLVSLLALSLLAVTLGSLLGQLSTRHHMAGLILYLVGIILMMALASLTIHVMGSDRVALWGDLPWIIPTASLVGAALCDLLIGCNMRKAVVL